MIRDGLLMACKYYLLTPMSSCTYLDTVYDTAYDLIVEKALYSNRLSYSDSIICHEGNNLEISDMHYIVYAYYFYSCYFITIIALLYSIIRVNLKIFANPFDVFRMWGH